MKIHFMGIGGSGIAGVATIAKKLGHEVTGCDLEESTSYNEAFEKGHSVEHLKDIDLVVASPAIFYQSSDNPEFIKAKKLGKLITWQEFVGKYLQEGKKVICVAGTHGKSTTTAMVGKLLTDCGFDPTVIMGAKYSSWNGTSRFGKGDFLVIEADEFNNNFLNYDPDYIILNNIEFDHPDFFKDEDAVKQSFIQFVNKLKGERVLIVNSSDKNVSSVLSAIGKVKIINYAQSEDLGVLLSIPGIHNLTNALGVVKLGLELGIDKPLILQSLATFPGISRRLELLGRSSSGFLVYDDYAHHPTAIKATIEAIREKYPKERLWVIDEPHGYLRTKSLLPLYAGVFSGADKVIIGPIFKARDEIDETINEEIVAKSVMHDNAKGLNHEEIIKEVKNNAEEGDIILVMGAGESYKWAREILAI